MKKLVSTFAALSLLAPLAAPVALARAEIGVGVKAGVELDELASESAGIEAELEQENEREVVEVKAPAALEHQAQQAVDKDKNITDIEVSDTEQTVQVSYKLRAKLFGFITLPYTLQTKVDVKGKKVEAHGPWWLIFAKDNSAQVQTALEQDASLTASTNQGQILSKVIATLKVMASASFGN